MGVRGRGNGETKLRPCQDAKTVKTQRAKGRPGQLCFENTRPSICSVVSRQAQACPSSISPPSQPWPSSPEELLPLPSSPGPPGAGGEVEGQRTRTWGLGATGTGDGAVLGSGAGHPECSQCVCPYSRFLLPGSSRCPPGSSPTPPLSAVHSACSSLLSVSL